MQVRLIAVGKVKERGLRDSIDDYLGRVRRYASVQEIELRETRDVAARFRKAIPERSRVVALEVRGKPWSSDQLAEFIGGCEVHSVPTIAFLIGGSYGLPQEISKSAHLQLSLSAMTLPHRLARLFLAEQIYRGFTILRGEPYSH